MLDSTLKRFITVGRLTIRWPDGRMTSYGGSHGPEAAIEINTLRTVWRLALNPGLALGEAYMDGTLVPVGCSIFEVLDVLTANVMDGGRNYALDFHTWLATTVRRIAQFNPATRARQNVAHHYDLNGRLYSLFLDRDRQYSCAYFRTGEESIEEAQAAKKRHIAAKLCLDRPGLTVLGHRLRLGRAWH